jgi:sigma54-dependent transcription regulator
VNAGSEKICWRINLCTFSLPGLQSRPEDIEPNLQFELDQYAQKNGTHVTFSKEARKRFLDFALSPAAAWKGNFRDLMLRWLAWPLSPLADASPLRSSMKRLIA